MADHWRTPHKLAGDRFPDKVPSQTLWEARMAEGEQRRAARMTQGEEAEREGGVGSLMDDVLSGFAGALRWFKWCG